MCHHEYILVIQLYKAFGGNVGIGTPIPGSKLDGRDTTAADQVILNVLGSSATINGGFVNLLVGADADRIGLLTGRSESSEIVFVDDSENVRIKGGFPTSNTDGTVVGTQTSVREEKQDISGYTDYAAGLDMLLSAPLHKFRYKKEVEGYGENSSLAKYRIGFIADEVDPQFMWGEAIDQVSVNGLLMASIKQQQSQIEQLKKIVCLDHPEAEVCN